MNIHQKFTNEQNSYEQESPSTAISLTKPENHPPDPTSHSDTKNSKPRALRVEESTPSFQFLETVQSPTTPALFEKQEPLSSNEKNFRKRDVKVVIEKHSMVNSQTFSKDSSDILMSRLNSIGQGESPMRLLHYDSIDKDLFGNRGGTMSNFWGSSNELESGVVSPPMKQSVIGSERWLTDTIVSEDDNTERMWKKQKNVQGKGKKLIDLFVLNEDEDNLKSVSARTINREDEKKMNSLFNIREIENMNDREMNTYEQQNANMETRNRDQGRQSPLNNRNNAPRAIISREIPINNTVAASANQEQGSNNVRSAVDQAPVRQLSHAEQLVSSLTDINLDANLYLKRRIALFLAISIGCVFVLLSISGRFSFHSLFYIFHGYLIYFGIENIVRAFCVRRESWKKSEDLFKILDAICGIVFLASIQGKLAKIISVSMVAFVPFVATAIGYCMTSKAPSVFKRRKIVIYSVYAIQTCFITAKLDRILDWDWKIIFGMGWICMGIIGLYLIGYSIMFVLAIFFSIFRQRLFEEISIILQFVGLIWHLLYYGLSAIAALAFIGVAQAYENPGNFTILNIAAYIGIGMACFLAIYTVIAFKPLIRFMEIFNKVGNQPEDLEVPQQYRATTTTVNLHIEKKESYFVMLSSTYFLPLDGKFISRNEQKLKKIKDTVLSFRLWKPKARVEESLQLTNINEAVDINILKQYKEALDEKFTKIGGQTKSEIDTIKTLTSPRIKVATQKIESIANLNKKGKDHEKLEVIKSSKRMNLSADDVNFKDLVGNKSIEVSCHEGALCYLCFDSPPNAVLMKCGHGGICYECANALVKKKNECMECRSPVEMIYKVDPNPKMADIIKGVEICKVQVN